MVRGCASFRFFLCVTAMLLWARPGLAQVPQEAAGVLAVPLITIYPGDTITPDMVGEREFGQLRPVRGGYVASAGVLVGKVARRTLLPGQAIPGSAVENAKLVQKGVPVPLVFEEGGLTITALAAPLQAGEINETVRARNVDSGLIVYGTVQEDGTLRIGGMPR
ncbi:flagellar basal body P-ring formation chaperone FlgA [Pseudochelatococcus sp.]|uniref:flagellar basal body P-ring formation chaperone FlgA n=1 Tax=Pseudochelatococcus sp. TaxID=2020869 RepID=UPI003D8E7DAB